MGFISSGKKASLTASRLPAEMPVIVLSELLFAEFRQTNFCQLVHALTLGQVRKVLRGKSAARGGEVEFHWLSHNIAHLSTVCVGFSN